MNTANDFSFDRFEQAIREVLSTRPSRDMHVKEVMNILAEHLGLMFQTSEAQADYERLMFWIGQPDLDDAKVVCADIELVRFGAIAPRESQVAGGAKKNMGPRVDPCLAHPAKVRRFCEDTAKVDFTTISQYRGGVEPFARRIDAYVASVLAGETPDLIIAPRVETIDPSEREMIKSDNAGDKHYITVSDLLKCIAHGRNTGMLNEFCMKYFTAMYRYQKVSSEMKSQMIADHESTIARLERALNEQARVAAERDEAARIRDAEQASRINKVLGVAEELKDQNSDLQATLDETNESLEEIKVQNDKLHVKADDLLDGQKRLVKEAAKIQRRAPVKVKNRDREPFMGMTYFLHNNEAAGRSSKNTMVAGATIRMVPHMGQAKPLQKKMTKMLTGDYRITKTLCVQTRHQIGIAPVYAPDQRNWIDAAQQVFNKKLTDRLAAEKSDRQRAMSRANATIDAITKEPDYSKKVIKTTRNIPLLEHNIMRSQSLADAFPNEPRHIANVAKFKEQLADARQALSEARATLAREKARVIEAPIRFGKDYIDFQSSKYFTLKEIIDIFEQLIIETQGILSVSNMTQDLLEVAADAHQGFVADLRQNHRDGVSELRKEAEKVFAASAERISRNIAESVLEE